MPVINRRTWLTWPWAGAACAAGCAWLPRERQASVLVVMLPGAYSVPREFIDQGFVSRLHAQGFAVDVALADAHLGYAENGTLLERLRDDVIAPAQREGYRRIWLVGISLGGFASLGLGSAASGLPALGSSFALPSNLGIHQPRAASDQRPN